MKRFQECFKGRGKILLALAAICLIAMSGAQYAVAETVPKDTIREKESVTLTASVVYPEHSGAKDISRTYQWFVEPFHINGNPGEGSISGKGRQATLRGVSRGQVLVTCKKSIYYKYKDSRIGMMSYYNEYDESWIYEVTAAIEPSSVSLEPNALELEVGHTGELKASVLPAGAFTTYNYSTSDPNVAEVSDAGLVRAVRAGKAVITVRTANGKTASCSVTARNAPLALSATEPKNGAREVSCGQTIKITYNQGVRNGTGISGLTVTDNTAGKTIGASVSVNGNVLSVVPQGGLKAGHAYTVNLPAGMLTASDGNSSSAAASFSFSTKAVELETNLTGRADVDVNMPVGILCGGKAREGGRWMEISLIDNRTGQPVACTLEISGRMITVTPQAPLDDGTRYTLTVPKGAVLNEEGIPLDSDWSVSFTTKPGKLRICGTYPENGEENVAVSATGICMNFNCPLNRGILFQKISLSDRDTGNKVAGTADLRSVEEEGGGSVLSFSSGSSLKGKTNYRLSVPAGALCNAKGEYNTEAFTLDFSTASDKAQIGKPTVTVDRYDQVGRVSISAVAGSDIYYTLDGTNPMVNGVLYARPFYVPKSRGVISAVAVRDGSVSEIEEHEYQIEMPLWKWQAELGGSGSDSYKAIVPAGDGYVAVGSSSEESFGTGDWTDVAGKGGTDAVIVKYDASGAVEWKQNFGGSGDDFYTSVALLGDGILAAGWSDEVSFGTGDWTDVAGKGGTDAVLVKYDASGNIEWKQNFGGSGDDKYHAVSSSEDGFAAAGESGRTSFGTGDWEDVAAKNAEGIGDGILVKYDASGAAEWKANYGGGSGADKIYTYNRAYFKSVAACEDGYVVAGTSRVGKSYRVAIGKYSCTGNDDAVVVKYNLDGNEEWHSRVWGSVSGLNSWTGYRFESVAKAGDGYVAVGIYNDTASVSFEKTVRVRFGLAGETVSVTEGDGWYGEYTSVVACEDGYVAVQDTALRGFDLSGVKQWERELDGSFHAAAVAGRSLVVAGSTSANASLVKYALEDDPEEESFPEAGAVSVSVKETAAPGETFTADVIFRPHADISGVNLEIAYPDCFSYLEEGLKTEYNSVSVTEKEAENGFRSLGISCDFTTENPVLEQGTACVLARVKFKANDDCAEGGYGISPVLEECFLVDHGTGKMTGFERAESGTVSVAAPMPKQIFIEKTAMPSRYRVVSFPKNARDMAVTWSVSDKEAGSIDGNGTFTPYKNGKVTIQAALEEAGLEARLEVETTGILTYLDSLEPGVGTYAKDYNEKDLERILYIPREQIKIKDGKSQGELEEPIRLLFTAAYEKGSLSSDELGILFNGQEKEIEIRQLPATLSFTKKEADHTDTVYTVAICGQPHDTHVYQEKWERDRLAHWHACESCGDRKDEALHQEDGGTVTKQPSKTEAGIRTYRCTVCGYETRTEEIDKLPGGTDGAGGKDSSGQKNSGQTPVKAGGGKPVSIGKNVYKIMKSKTAAFVKTTDKSSVLTVPGQVKIGGVTYKVTSIANNAFKGNRKVKRIIIGKHVAKIGTCAFQGCKNLKRIDVKSKRLSSIGKKAFKGIKSTAMIKVPKSKLKKYRKLFRGKGQGKKVKIKK